MAGAGDLLLPDPREVEALNRARQHVLERIAAACGRAGRDPGAVALLAVSKNVPADRLRAAVAAGLTTLGENRVQEAEAKVDLVPGANWELVGPLQSNKARRALETFARIQSIDSLELAQRLDRLAGEVHPGRRYPVLVQVNVDQDPGKAGLPPAGTEEAMDQLANLANLAFEGFMTIGRLTSTSAEARQTFEGLRETAARVRRRWPGIGPELSMGMSDDFELAVEAGATIVRVGRALFGERH
jgi:pyridoxal phosphate enzyme (YggS family)